MKIYPFEQFDQTTIDHSFYTSFSGGLLKRNRFQIYHSNDIREYGHFEFENGEIIVEL